jgi:hypothetical protein
MQQPLLAMFYRTTHAQQMALWTKTPNFPDFAARLKRTKKSAT